jgi:hypothetical protein
VLIILIWRKLVPTVERLHVEGMDESPRSWKRDVLFGASSCSSLRVEFSSPLF